MKSSSKKSSGRSSKAKVSSESDSGSGEDDARKKASKKPSSKSKDKKKDKKKEDSSFRGYQYDSSSSDVDLSPKKSKKKSASTSSKPNFCSESSSSSSNDDDAQIYLSPKKKYLANKEKQMSKSRELLGGANVPGRKSRKAKDTLKNYDSDASESKKKNKKKSASGVLRSFSKLDSESSSSSDNTDNDESSVGGDSIFEDSDDDDNLFFANKHSSKAKGGSDSKKLSSSDARGRSRTSKADDEDPAARERSSSRVRSFSRTRTLSNAVAGFFKNTNESSTLALPDSNAINAKSSSSSSKQTNDDIKEKKKSSSSSKQTHDDSKDFKKKKAASSSGSKKKHDKKKSKNVSSSSSSSAPDDDSSDNEKKVSKKKEAPSEPLQSETTSQTAAPSKTITSPKKTKPAPTTPIVPYENSRKAIDLKLELDDIVKKESGFDESRWKNPMKDWKVKDSDEVCNENTAITVTIPSGTDFWGNTKYNFLKFNPTYYSERVVGEYDCFVHITGNFTASYQKAGILAYIDDTNWLFTGMECRIDKNGKKELYVTNILTKNSSDYTTFLLPSNAIDLGVWFNIKRIDGGDYESFYSYHGVDWKQVRHGHLADNRLSKIGVAGSYPFNPKGRDNSPFKATFDFYTCRQKKAVE